MAASAAKKVVHIGGGLTAGHNAAGDVSEEVEINDADPKTRYNLTKRTTQEEIMRKTNCVVSTRRALSPDLAPPENPTPRPAFLSPPPAARRTRPARRGRYRPPGQHVAAPAKASADDKPLFLLVQPGAALALEGLETKRTAVQARGRRARLVAAAHSGGLARGVMAPSPRPPSLPPSPSPSHSGGGRAHPVVPAASPSAGGARPGPVQGEGLRVDPEPQPCVPAGARRAAFFFASLSGPLRAELP